MTTTPNTRLRVSWSNFYGWSNTLAQMLTLEHRLNPFQAICAVSRGGLVPAAICAQRLGITFIDTVCLKSYDGEEPGPIEVIKKPMAATRDMRVLIVDDICDTGATIKKIKGYFDDGTYVVVFAKPQGLVEVNHYVLGVMQDTWVEFPWEG